MNRNMTSDEALDFLTVAAKKPTGYVKHNHKVMETINRLRKIVRLFDKACDDQCKCSNSLSECKHCDLVIEARELMNGTEGLEITGN